MSRLSRRHLAAGTAVAEPPTTLIEGLETTDETLLPMPEYIGESTREPFRFCLNTSTIRGHKLPLDSVVDIAAGAGYEAIEPWIDELERYVEMGGNLLELGAKIRDLGLTVEGGIGFFEWIVDDPDQRNAGLEKARQAMGLLARLGGKRIAAPAFGAHGSDAAPVNLFVAAERYRALLEIGDQIGVVPMLEVWGFSRNVSRMGEGLLILAECDHPDACLLADIYHMYKGGSPVSSLSHLNESSLGLFHVNDYPAIAPAAIVDADRVYPGDGVAPLTALFRTLRDIGYNRFLSLELFNAEYYREDPLQVARTGREKLRAVIEQSL